MKTLKTTLIVLVLSFFVSTISAQQSVILNKKTSKVENNTSITIKFDVDKMTSAAQAETFRSKMATSVGADGKVTVAPMAGGKSTYSLMFKRKAWSVDRLQAALLAAGLNDVVIDGEKLKTTALAAKFKKK
ncbi:hypothetical protein BH10BAC1_BH10BAC1_13210 [soil metagenome]